MEESLLEDVDIDPKLLESLTPSEKMEAISAAKAAKRAEERAAERQALERKKEERKRLERSKKEALSQLGLVEELGLKRTINIQDKERPSQVKFVSKRQRNTACNTASVQNALQIDPPEQPKITAQFSKRVEDNDVGMSQAEIAEIKKSYLGRDATLTEAEAQKERQQQLALKRKKRKEKKQVFKFQWDDSEDTLGGKRAAAVDPLYVDLNQLISVAKTSDRIGKRDIGTRHSMESVSDKPLERMTSRDWRIVRENFDIRVRGGRAPPPLRKFREAPLHPALFHAIEHTLKFKEPSPIQRQAIPIGLQRRDLIGIAETGSGKTLAFGIPLCNFILNLPSSILKSVAEHGPLALVMAPTRELALQIDVEFQKLLSDQVQVKTLPVVGGQSIQSQAQQLSSGVHIVVGTPGRINECLEMAYLVLNQCSYIVLDEADRMIDLGFAPQIENILENMGGSLKSQNEQEAYKQEVLDMKHGVLPKHRLTAMFSATMPPEVERMAKDYLRHPAIVSIGDADSSKNTRIAQNILYLSSPAQKEKTLRELLSKSTEGDKIIVFVNEKKHAEGVARTVEHSGKRCVVLHGGKSQEQREENLASFRRGGVVLVATDVAGRGLDIPDVSHVINYDLPSRSIDSYCHRIGRTGRAGKLGTATSFLTDEDEGIMAPLLAYLQSTNAPVPDKLARHPAAVGNANGPMY